MNLTRRQYLAGSTITAVSLAGAQFAHAQGTDETVKAVLVGCGGRGCGAAHDFLTNPHTKIIGLADVFEDRVTAAAERFGVPKEATFLGFDAYRKVLEYGKQNGAVYALLVTPPGFRPIHYKAAVKMGYNCFLEKPICVDAPGYRMCMEVNRTAADKGLKIGVGMQRRHQDSYLNGIKEIWDGKIGELITARVYWNMGEITTRGTGEEPTEMQRQIRNRYFYVWLCGDNIVEQHVHNIDVGNWVMGKGDPNFHPVSCNCQGGREVRPRTSRWGEIFNHHACEFIYADGRRMFSQSRQMAGCWNCVNEFVDGTRGSSSVASHGRKHNPYEQEHTDLIEAIKSNLAYHEGWQGATAAMTGILGRTASYSGQEIKWDDAVNNGKAYMIYENHDQLTLDSDPPVLPDENGNYKIPVPGQTKPW